MWMWRRNVRPSNGGAGAAQHAAALPVRANWAQRELSVVCLQTIAAASALEPPGADFLPLLRCVVGYAIPRRHGRLWWRRRHHRWGRACWQPACSTTVVIILALLHRPLHRPGRAECQVQHDICGPDLDPQPARVHRDRPDAASREFKRHATATVLIHLLLDFPVVELQIIERQREFRSIDVNATSDVLTDRVLQKCPQSSLHALWQGGGPANSPQGGRVAKQIK
mmetsp:Transcript_5251/g.12938  ORF Transcript_5251/g.12938 Transcript_5251/m.12938 type:complete len:225 (+) Transcript_5251:972-1646(+)